MFLKYVLKHHNHTCPQQKRDVKPSAKCRPSPTLIQQRATAPHLPGTTVRKVKSQPLPQEIKKTKCTQAAGIIHTQSDDIYRHSNIKNPH